MHIVFGHDGKYVDIFRNLGCKVYVLNQKHWLNSCSIIWHLKLAPHRIYLIFQYLLLIKRINPNLLYINTIVGPEIAIAAKILKVPSIWHIRDMFNDVGGDLTSPKFIRKKHITKLIKALSTELITVSNAVAANFFGNNHSKINIIHNGVSSNFKPTELFTVRKSLIIGVPGTLRKMKGHEYFFKSINLVKNLLPPFEIRITGEGSKNYKSKLSQILTSLSLTDNVIFTGNLETMNLFLNDCDIVVIPSSCDPLPRTVMETMAAGRALVATKVGGIPEMVDHQINGILVDYGNIRQLANAILSFATSFSLREQMGIAASEKAKTEFTILKYQESILQLIKSTI